MDTLESIQYCATLAIAGTIKDTSKEKLYNNLAENISETSDGC